MFFMSFCVADSFSLHGQLHQTTNIYGCIKRTKKPTVDNSNIMCVARLPQVSAQQNK